MRPDLKSEHDAKQDEFASALDTLKENLTVMFTPDELIEWLWSPNQLFGNKSAMWMLATGKRQKVFDTVNSIAEGTFP